MSRLGVSVRKVSRGSSRGIQYYDPMKNSLPSYGYSSKKDHKFYDSKHIKNQTPAYSSALKSSIREKNTYNYEYLLDKDKDKQAIFNELDNRR